MFKKSKLDNVKQEPPVGGSIIFDGYAEVRTAPKSPPSHLKQRIKSGKDIIAIWFQHTHAERFQAMEDGNVKIFAKGLKGQSLIPTIEEMTPQEIVEFCKSIDVHPAHLVPFDRDPKLSLPTPLLELLIDIAYDSSSENTYDRNDVYLAKAAIAFECKRIRAQMSLDKNMIIPKGKIFAHFSQACGDVLNDPQSIKNMALANITHPSHQFGVHASRSYPYVERVRDMAVIQAEASIARSHERLNMKQETLEEYIAEFKKTYKDHIHPGVSDDIEASIFLDDVIMGLAEKKISHDQATMDNIGGVIQELLNNHVPYHLHYKMAQAVFAEKFGMRENDYSFEDETYFQELDPSTLDKLSSIIRLIFKTEDKLTDYEADHSRCESEYIRQVGHINDAFNSIGDAHQRNLINNRVLLGIHNISIQKYVAPQSSPR